MLSSTHKVIERVIMLIHLRNDSPRKRLIAYIESDLHMQVKYLHRSSKVNDCKRAKPAQQIQWLFCVGIGALLP